MSICSRHKPYGTVTLSDEGLVPAAASLRENSELREANNSTRFFRKRPEEVKPCERHVFVLNKKDNYRVLRISESGYILGQHRRAFTGCVPRKGESKSADGSLTSPHLNFLRSAALCSVIRCDYQSVSYSVDFSTSLILTIPNWNFCL